MSSDTFILRPLTTGELLDRAFSLYRRNFWKFVGALAIAHGIVTGFQLILVAVKFPFPDELGTSSPVSQFVYLLEDIFFDTSDFPLILNLIKMIVLDCFGIGALVYLVLNAYFQTPLSISQAYQHIFKSGLKLIGVRAYVWLGILLIFVPGLFSLLGWLALPGILLLVTQIMIPMVTIPLLVERQPITLIPGRLLKLIMNRLWWVLGIELFLLLLNLVIWQLQTTAQTGLIRLIFGTATNQLLFGNLTIQALISQIFTMGTTLIISTFAVVTHLLLYFDLRVRYESLDLVLVAEQHPQEFRNLLEILFSLPTPDSAYKATMNDLGQLTIAGWGIVGLAYALGFSIIVYSHLF